MTRSRHCPQNTRRRVLLIGLIKQVPPNHACVLTVGQLRPVRGNRLSASPLYLASLPVAAPILSRMSEVKITALENGPLDVDGACTVLTSDGTLVKESTKIFLCRCGHSAKKPV